MPSKPTRQAVLKLIEELAEAGKGPRLGRTKRDRINSKLNELTRNNYFLRIPLSIIFDILEEEEVVPLQEDNTEWAGILSGDKGRLMIRLAPAISRHGEFYTPYVNAALNIHWHKMESGRYEVIAYVS